MTDEREARWPAWIDGEIVPLEAARVPLVDLGVLHGRAVFTTVPLVEGRARFVREHRARLVRDAAAYGIDFDGSELDAGLAALLPGLPREAGAVRVHVSAGGAGRTWCALFARRVPDGDPRGVSLAADATLPAFGDGFARHKGVGRAGLELARVAARRAGADEALVHDASGRWIGASAASLVVLVAERVVAPGPADGALDGVARALLLAAARERTPWPIEERAVTGPELAAASEILLVGSVRGVRPARVLTTIGAAGPGPPRALPGPNGPLARAWRALWDAACARDAAAAADSGQKDARR